MMTIITICDHLSLSSYILMTLFMLSLCLFFLVTVVTYWSCAVHPDPSVVAGSRQGYARFLQHSDITGGLGWSRNGFYVIRL